jgi:hypothetical protein
MKHYSRIATIQFCFLFLLACGGASRSAPDKRESLNRKTISRKDVYRVYTNADSTQTTKLEKSELFDRNGNVIEQIFWIPDSTYLSYNRCKEYMEWLGKPQTFISDRYTFRYSSDTLLVITSFMCDSLPLQKQIFHYRKIQLDELW